MPPTSVDPLPAYMESQDRYALPPETRGSGCKVAMNRYKYSMRRLDRRNVSQASRAHVVTTLHPLSPLPSATSQLVLRRPRISLELEVFGVLDAGPAVCKRRISQKVQSKTNSTTPSGKLEEKSSG